MIRLQVAAGIPLTLGCCAVFSMEYVVAPYGTDQGTGLQSSPCRTIQQAVDKMKAGDVCRVKPGVYGETVRFVTSGTAGAPIRLIADGTVIVTGADPVRNWTPHERGIWKAPVSWDLGLTANQLFIDGTWYQEARFPNVDDWDRLDCADRLSQRPNRCGDREGISGTFPEDSSATIMRPTTVGIGIHDLADDQHKGWPIEQYRVHISTRPFGKELSSPSQNPYSPLHGKPRDHWKGAAFWSQGWWWSGGGAIKESWDDAAGNVHFIVHTDRIRWCSNGVFIGHYDFIDTQGEWVVKDGYVYLLPPPGVDPNKASIMLKRRHLAFDFRGKSTIEVSGFHVMGASALMDSAVNCVIDKCHFYCLSHYMVHDWGGNGYVALEDTALATGNRGIVISGSSNVIRNSSVTNSAASAIVASSPTAVIDNNLIRNINYPNTYAAGIYILAGGVTITRNTFSHFGRSALTGGQTCTITHNKFLESMILSGDGGTIYTFGTPDNDAPAGELAYNWFAGCYGEPSAYIYNDACGGGKDIVHHNVFFPNLRVQGKFVPLASCQKEWYNNTWDAPVMNRDWAFAIYDDSTNVPWNGAWKNNLLALDTAKDWRFADRSAGDYTLTSGSAAIDKGVAVAGITDGYKGAAPDLGAYESGGAAWVPGHRWGMPREPGDVWAAAHDALDAKAVVANPAVRVGVKVRRDHLWISNPTGSRGSLFICDLRGRLVMAAQLAPDACRRVEIERIPAGTFMVRIETAGLTSTRKIVIR